MVFVCRSSDAGNTIQTTSFQHHFTTKDRFYAQLDRLRRQILKGIHSYEQLSSLLRQTVQTIGELELSGRLCLVVEYNEQYLGLVTELAVRLPEAIKDYVKVESVELYTLVQYCQDLLPRLYLMAVAILVDVEDDADEEGRIVDRFKDLVSFCTAALQPINGIFLGHFVGSILAGRIIVKTNSKDDDDDATSGLAMAILDCMRHSMRLWGRLNDNSSINSREAAVFVLEPLERLSQLTLQTDVDALQNVTETFFRAVLDELPTSKELSGMAVERFIFTIPLVGHPKALMSACKGIAGLPYIDKEALVGLLFENCLPTQPSTRRIELFEVWKGTSACIDDFDCILPFLGEAWRLLVDEEMLGFVDEILGFILTIDCEKYEEEAIQGNSNLSPSFTPFTATNRMNHLQRTAKVLQETVPANQHKLVLASRNIPKLLEQLTLSLGQEVSPIEQTEQIYFSSSAAGAAAKTCRMTACSFIDQFTGQQPLILESQDDLDGLIRLVGPLLDQIGSHRVSAKDRIWIGEQVSRLLECFPYGKCEIVIELIARFHQETQQRLDGSSSIWNCIFLPKFVSRLAGLYNNAEHKSILYEHFLSVISMLIRSNYSNDEFVEMDGSYLAIECLGRIVDIEAKSPPSDEGSTRIYELLVKMIEDAFPNINNQIRTKTLAAKMVGEYLVLSFRHLKSVDFRLLLTAAIRQCKQQLHLSCRFATLSSLIGVLMLGETKKTMIFAEHETVLLITDALDTLTRLVGSLHQDSDDLRLAYVSVGLDALAGPVGVGQRKLRRRVQQVLDDLGPRAHGKLEIDWSLLANRAEESSEEETFQSENPIGETADALPSDSLAFFQSLHLEDDTNGFR